MHKDILQKALVVIFSAGMAYGAINYRVSDIEVELANHKAFRERVIDSLARIETKLEDREYRRR